MREERRLVRLLGELPDEVAAAPLLREHGAGLLACAASHGLRGVLAHHLTRAGVPLPPADRALGLADQARQQRSASNSPRRWPRCGRAASPSSR